MILQLKPVTRALCVLSLLTASQATYAAMSAEQIDAAMQKMTVQAQQLQQQMDQLHTDMMTLRREQASLAQAPQAAPTTKSQTQVAKAKQPAAANTQVASQTQTYSNTVDRGSIPSSEAKVRYVSAKELNVEPVKEEKIVEPNGKVETKPIPYGETMLANIGGFAVITSPYLHPEQEYSGGDLVVNYSSINKDVYMMKQRQQFSNVMSSQGFGLPTRGGSLLELSGEVQMQANAIDTFSDNHTTDLYLSDAELDMQALINRWITAFMSFSYNNTPNAVGQRVGGEIDLDNAFFTIGNLNTTKWRLTAGQLYVPFGQYNSFLISDPLNKVIFRTKGQPVIVGWGVPGEDGFAFSAFGFKGTAHDDGDASSSNPRINQYGGDANYQFHLGGLKTAFGVSYIADIADSSGMQHTGGSDGQFEGFSDDVETEKLHHEVPGIDARALINYSRFTIVGEYDSALRSFDPMDLSFNGAGARPSAYHVEGFYGFDFFKKPSTVALGFDQTYQALALNVPASRIAAAFNISPWRNTIASLELRHDWNYGEDDFASGSGATVVTTPAGSSSNAIFGQFQVYF